MTTSVSNSTIPDGGSPSGDTAPVRATAPVALSARALPAGVRQVLRERFRMPTNDDPAPASNRLAMICAWAAALGLGGMAVALRAFVGLISTAAGWYAPTVIAIGMIGIGATIGAFASIHRRRLPLALLGIATVTLITGWFVTGSI